MSYEVVLADNAWKFLEKCDLSTKNRITDKIAELEENPELGKPLGGNLAGLWSLRIGKYRTIYQVKDEELIVLVVEIGHRKNVYD